MTDVMADFELIGKLLAGIDNVSLKRLAVIRDAMEKHDLDFVGACALFEDVEVPDLIQGLWDTAAGFAQLATLHLEPDVLAVESQVSAFTGEPKVLLRFSEGERPEQGEHHDWALGMSPMQARHHAMSVLECSEAAEHDAALHAYIRDGGQGYEEAAAMVAAIRGFRRRYRGAQGEPETYRGP